MAPRDALKSGLRVVGNVVVNSGSPAVVTMLSNPAVNSFVLVILLWINYGYWVWMMGHSVE